MEYYSLDVMLNKIKTYNGTHKQIITCIKLFCKQTYKPTPITPTHFTNFSHLLLPTFVHIYTDQQQTNIK